MTWFKKSPLHAQRRIIAAGLTALALALASAPARADDARLRTLQAVERVCPMEEFSGFTAQLELPGSWLLSEEAWPDTLQPRRTITRLALPEELEMTLERRLSGGQLRQFRTEITARDGLDLVPKLQSISDGGCTVQSARAIRSGPGPWIYLDQLDGDLAIVRWTETLQAPWPAGSDPGGVRVALVDSGLAYDLDPFPERLARGANGQPLGYDFWDLDPWPYDGDVSRGAFFPIRHGTTVASIFVREAPDAAIIPYKYPRPDMDRLAELVSHAGAAGARILAMPLGSTRKSDWTAFAQAILESDLLVIVSAGNDGRDIDAAPIYPAALDLKNMIVVTSADDFGRLAEGSNWGARSVDVMLPAENLDVVDFRGATGVASGSSYAVPRLAALAARLLAREPDLTASDLKARLLARAVPSPFEREAVTAAGWLADPLAD